MKRLRDFLTPGAVFGATNLVGLALVVAGVAVIHGAGPALITAGALAIVLNVVELLLATRRR